MTSTLRRRLLAGAIDAGLVLGWALAAAGIAGGLQSAGVLRGQGLLALNLLGIAAVVLPATIGLTLLEAGRYEATPGKLRFGLRVRREESGERIGWARSLLRNLLKVGLPWTLLHLAVLTTVVSGGPAAWVGTIVAVALPCAYLASLLGRDGRTPYDHLAGTTVISTAPGRRFAEP